MIRDGRAFARLEEPIDGWLDQVVIVTVFDAIVVFAAEATPQNDETGAHIVMPVRHYRSPLLHGEDLLTEDQFTGEPWRRQRSTNSPPRGNARGRSAASLTQ
jgi:hypothetical protein